MGSRRARLDGEIAERKGLVLHDAAVGGSQAMSTFLIVLFLIVADATSVVATTELRSTMSSATTTAKTTETRFMG
jgi:hypothetical protein